MRDRAKNRTSRLSRDVQAIEIFRRFLEKVLPAEIAPYRLWRGYANDFAQGTISDL